MRAVILSGVVAGVLAGGCGGVPQADAPGAALTVVDAYAAEPLSREVGAAYLTILNTSATPDTLVGARTPLAGTVHLHRMGGVGAAQMKSQDAVEVPATGRLQLRPGGLHLMLVDLVTMPRAGDTIALTLTFRRAGDVTVHAPVLSYLEVGERAAVGTGEPGR